ncbi:MAG: FecR domain-containing protein, partial [bacterium]|nr:FecR domain-containing protein [bacterium]
MAAVLAAIALYMPTSPGQELLHARISFESGGAMVKGTADDEWSYATTNTLVLPGDTLWADEQGMLELELSGGSFLRMADGSKAQIVQVPPSGIVQAWTGSFYVHRIGRSTGDVIVQTPACAVDVPRDSHVRVDVEAQGLTTVSVHWGKASVTTEFGPTVIVTPGRRAYVEPGLQPSTPVPYDKSREDSFDAWSRERAKLLALGTRTIPLPVPADSVPIGVSDLSVYGEWVYVETRPYWRPTCAVEYVPYRSGHWSYVPGCGYVWVGSYPFCYVTSHYGRWTHNPRYGYIWSYGDAWSPAWVASVRYGSNFVWCPLDPYDQPLAVGSACFDVGGVRISIGASSYCAANDLFVGPCPTYACTSNGLGYVNARDVYIWNIYAPGSGGRTPPFLGSSALVRDYSPRRVIRGPDMAGPSRRAAKERVPRLESGMGRSTFRSVEATGQRNVRTSPNEPRRAARARSVRVDSEAAINTSAEMRRLEQRTG